MTKRFVNNAVQKTFLIFFIICIINLSTAWSDGDVSAVINTKTIPSNQLVFLSEPVNTIVNVEEPYVYSVIFQDFINSPTEITLTTDHQWLKLNAIDIYTGTALLGGTPEKNHIGAHMVTIHAKTKYLTAYQSFMITVPVLYDSFEHDTSNWSIVKDDQYINEWKFGNIVSKTGTKSAYTEKLSKNRNESILERSVDLSHIINGKLTFVFRCNSCELYDDGFPGNYGQLIILGKKGSTYKHDLLYGGKWCSEKIDLRSYSGETITISFKWIKEISYGKYNKYGISIDDFLITGEYYQKPIFINEPEKRITPAQKYTYQIQLNNIKDTWLNVIKLPKWLKIEGELLSNNTILSGMPDNNEMKVHSVIIEAENSAGATVLSYSLEAMYFFDDFESDLPNRSISGEAPYTHNFWVFGDNDSHEQDKMAYISYDKEGKYSEFKTHKTSRASLTYTFDFAHLSAPQLAFSWQCFSPYYYQDYYFGYGEVYVTDIDGTEVLVSEEKELEGSDKWAIKTIDLSDYQGTSISLIFKWINDEYGFGYMRGLMIDDIEIRGNYSTSPIIETPIFVSNPYLNGYTVYAGDIYTYTIITKDNNNDSVYISCETCPEWLTIVNMEPDKGTALLTGKPSYNCTEDIVINAWDGINTVQQSFELHVLEKNPYRFDRRWPVSDIHWTFSQIQGVDINSKNQVFVTDINTHQIFKYNSNGKLLRLWGGYGGDDGKFNTPLDLAIDHQDNVFVLDAYNYRVQKFDCNGKFLAKFEEDQRFVLSNLTVISIDNQGSFYIGENMLGRIYKFNSKGEYLTSWELEQFDGNVHNVLDIAVDNEGYVYVCDGVQGKIFNHYIQKFDSEGNFISKFGGFGSEDGQFNVPKGIAINDTSIYVIDQYNARIQQYDHDFSFIKSWSTKLYNFESWLGSAPISIAISSDGYIYITDSGKNINYGVGCIKKFGSNGELFDVWKNFGEKEGYFFHPTGIDVDKNDTIYVCDQENHRIQIRQKGSGWKAWTHEVEENESPIFPYDIAVNDRNNFVYVTDLENQRIIKYSKNGELIEYFFDDSNELLRPTGIAIDKEDFIYVADADTTHCRIVKYNEQTSEIHTWGKYGENEGEFRFPGEIAIDDINKWIYVTDLKNNCIQKFTLDGHFLLKWGKNQLFCPTGILVDHENNVIVVDRNHQSIKTFNPDGKYLYQMEEYGIAPGQLMMPSSIAMARNGHAIYITDNYLNRIQVYKKTNFTKGITKAIIASGKRSNNDPLSPKVESVAHQAYECLMNQGINKQYIYYLSSITPSSFDFDNNSLQDDIDDQLNFNTLNYAINEWPFQEPKADSLIIYFVDHGSVELFFMNAYSENDKLSADTLSIWLDSIQNKQNKYNHSIHQVILVYDACHSGSFIEKLKTQQDVERIVLSSTITGDAYFINDGDISFSRFFWSNIQKNYSVGQAYEFAKQSMSALKQTTQSYVRLNDNNNIMDLYPGNYHEIENQQSEILGGILIEYIGGNRFKISVNHVIDDTDIKHIFAMVKPENNADEIVDIQLVKNEYGVYTSIYERNNFKSAFDIIVYSEDIDGNTQLISKSSRRDQALIIAGYSKQSSMSHIIEQSAQNAINAMNNQGIHYEDIYMLSSYSVPPGLPENNISTISKANIETLLASKDFQNANDVIVYMIGRGFDSGFILDESKEEYLVPQNLNEYFNAIQSQISGSLIFIYDACQSGSFLTHLTSSNRMLISSTNIREPAFFSANGDISFSSFFWSFISSGINILEAYKRSDNAIKYISNASKQNQSPRIDYPEDLKPEKIFIGNEKMTASQEITTTNVITMKSITAIEVTSTVLTQNYDDISRVWAVVVPVLTQAMSFDPADICEHNFESIELTRVNNTDQYSGSFHDFSGNGTYDIIVYAINTDGSISEPGKSSILFPDTYEYDDTFKTARSILIDKEQRRNFFPNDDIDCLYFYALKDETYSIKIDETGSNFQPDIQLYKKDEYKQNLYQNGMDFICPEDAYYFLKLSNQIQENSDQTEYRIRVHFPTAPDPDKQMVKGTIRDKKANTLLEDIVVKIENGGYAETNRDGSFQIEISALITTINLLARDVNNKKYEDYYQKNIQLEETINILDEIKMNPKEIVKKLILTVPGTIVENSKLQAKVELKPPSSDDYPIPIVISSDKPSRITFENIVENNIILFYKNDREKNFIIKAINNDFFDISAEIVWIETSAKDCISDSKPISIINDSICDINHSGVIDMKDVILIFQVISGMHHSDNQIFNDVGITDSDVNIGIEDALYLLKKLSQQKIMNIQ